MERVILTGNERVAHAHMGVVVSVQVPLAEGRVPIPVPLCLAFPLRGSFFYGLRRETPSFNSCSRDLSEAPKHLSPYSPDTSFRPLSRYRLKTLYQWKIVSKDTCLF